MLCARCGHATPGNPPRCSRCGADAPAGSIAADTLAVDTTGLPDGGTFGASTGLGLGFGAETTVSPDGGPAVEPLPPAGTTIAGMAADATTGGNPNATANATTIADVRAPREGPLSVGQSFGPRYQILRVLGVGGMGAVYQAWDAELGVAVALKVIRTAHRTVSPELEKRFKNELLLARQVTHKSVVRIHDLGEIDGIKYITMPYIQGDDLAAVLRQRRQADGRHDAGHRARRGARPARRSRRGRRPSRSEAGERDGQGRRRAARGDHGLRHLDVGRQRRRGRRDRHAGVHGAGAGRGRERGRASGHLCVRTDPLRAADRSASAPRRPRRRPASRR